MPYAKSKECIEMWYSKENDLYTYNVKNNTKGEYAALLIEFFYTQQDRITRKKEKKSRYNKMHYNIAILKRIEKAKEREQDLAKYGACVAIGERRRIGDISANAIQNYNVLCKACADV
ncbi:hypothetical protein ID1059_08120 [Helicobacter pylori]